MPGAARPSTVTAGSAGRLQAESGNPIACCASNAGSPQPQRPHLLPVQAWQAEPTAPAAGAPWTAPAACLGHTGSVGERGTAQRGAGRGASLTSTRREFPPPPHLIAVPTPSQQSANVLGSGQEKRAGRPAARDRRSGLFFSTWGGARSQLNWRQMPQRTLWPAAGSLRYSTMFTLQRRDEAACEASLQQRRQQIETSRKVC